MVLKEGEIYRHYKGSLYQIIKIAYSTEGKNIITADDVDDSVKMVIYQSVKPHPTLGHYVWWARPYTVFTDIVTVDGKEAPRFTEVEQEPADDCSLCIAHPEIAKYVRSQNDNTVRKKRKKQLVDEIPF